MKRKLLMLILACISISFGFAQTISMTGYGGYTFQDRLNYGNAYGYLNESGHWGVSLEGINRRRDGIELLYQQQLTHVPVYYLTLPNSQVNSGNDKTVMSYLVLNAMHHFMMGPVEPYVGIGIGAGFINNKSYSNETRFAWDAKLGLEFKVSPVVGIKVQAQLFSIVQAAGGSFYVSQDGSVTSVTSYSSIFQFGFSSGLCFNFANAD